MNNVEAVRDILEYLNQRDLKDHTADTHHDRPFFIDNQGIYANYAGFRLASLFQPIVRISDEAETTAVAYEAFLAAHTAKGLSALGSALSPESIFSQQGSTAEITTLDRLARTLHALNFLLQEGAEQLHLNVHPNHLLAVSNDHGHVFERILRQCGLDTASIVLEIPEYSIRDKKRLHAAIRSWQSRGYRIAIDNLGCGHTQFDRVIELSPDIVKIDRSLVHRATERSREYDTLRELAEKSARQDIHIIASGIENSEQCALMQSLGIHYLQGYLFGRPASECQPPVDIFDTGSALKAYYA